MKTTYKILLFFVISIAAFMGAALIIVSSNGNIFDDQSRFEEEVFEETEVDGTSVTTININTASSDVKFLKSDDETIKVVLEGRIVSLGENKTKREFSVEKVGNEVTIEVDVSNFLFQISFYRDVNLKVYLPQTYSGDVNLNTVSGDATIDDYEITNLKINTVSGDMLISSLELDKFQFNSVSGDLQLTEVSSASSIINTTSGDVDGDDVSGDIKFNSTSGDLEVKYLSSEFTIDVHTISGDIELNLIDEAEFNIDIDTISGTINTNNFEVTVKGQWSEHNQNGEVGDSDNTITIKTTSGDIDIF